VIKIVTVIIVIVGALLFVGTGDYNEEKREGQEYKDMVCGGHWPNYRELKLTCED
jgi:hypothetical protein